MEVWDRRNVQTLMKVGVFLQGGNLDKLHVRVPLGERSDAGHDSFASLAPWRIPQYRKYFIILASSVQCLLVFV